MGFSTLSLRRASLALALLIPAAVAGAGQATARKPWPGAPGVAVPGEVVIQASYLPDGEPLAPRWQNNDVLVAGNEWGDVDPSLACLEDGTLMAAVEHDGTEDRRVRIYRSVDGGESWYHWYDISPVEDATELSLAAAEGTENWLLLALRYGPSIIVVFRIDLDDPATWDCYNAAYHAGGVANPRLVTDSSEYSYWYPYVVYNYYVSDHWHLGFTRSTDYGVTWSPATELHEYCGPPGPYQYDGGAGHPDIDYGSGMLHVAYDDYAPACTVDSKEVYVRSSNDLGGSWSSYAQLTSDEDDEFDPAVGVVKGLPGAETVVVAYTRLWDGTDHDVWCSYSQDHGASWLVGGFCVACGSAQQERSPVLATSVDQGLFHLAYWVDYGIGYRWADHLAPTVWSPEQRVNYGSFASGTHLRPDVTVNPTQAAASEAGIAWTDVREGTADVYFDAPVTIGLGDIVIDTDPDMLDAPWELFGPGSYYLAGSGDAVLADMADGDYSLVWGNVPDWGAPLPNPAAGNLVEGQTLTFSGTYLRFAPRIIGIPDVGNDQGRYVRLYWEGSGYDAPGTAIDIAGYGVYRRQDGFKAPSAPGAGPAPASRAADDQALPAPSSDGRMEGWDTVGWISAHGEGIYQFVSPTLCDSTADAGVCWSVFFVRATTPDPFTFFDSEPDSGYSIDNLFPSAPLNPRLAGPDLLAWDMIPDPDLDYFSVYASDTETFDSYDLLGTTIDLMLDVAGSEGRYLAVTAKDFAGNESGLSIVLYNGTGVGDAPPARFALAQNVPNPFNPATEIRFELPRPAAVDLVILDLGGRVVRTLLDGVDHPEGRHGIVWDGRDDAGRPAASGVYFYRLGAGPFSQARKMTLLK
ncbi:MAG: hypothetical protein JW819_04710 [Candidatus Krumholzibacteriota bacterium]|nr:hypothetical protein [Candidatus Krumholzibacteriota bacterium]